MALKAFLLSLFLAIPGFSEPGSTGTNTFGGLNDTDSPNSILPSEAQSALNVEASLSGTSLNKRGGYIPVDTLGISTAPVTGAYQFVDSNGTLQTVYCGNRFCRHSANGSGYSNFITTATMPNRWSFVDTGGILYGVNDANDQPFSWNGTTLTQPLSPSVPIGSLIEMTKDRMAISGVLANPNAVYYSQSGVFTNFTTGINSADPWTDTFGGNGDRVTALKWDNGRLYIFKRASITACLLQDQFSTYCYPISSVIGTNAPNAIVSAPDGIYFQSQNGSYWQLSQYYGLQLISKRISKFVASQVAALSTNGLGSNTQTSQADWAAGTQYPTGSWDFNTIPGSVFPSSVTFNDMATADFSAGNTFQNIDTTTYSNAISLSSYTAEDRWTSGLVPGRLNWTTVSGQWNIRSDCGENCVSTLSGNNNILANVLNTTQISLPTASWNFDYYYQGPSGFPNLCIGSISPAPFSCFSFRFMKDAGGNYYDILVNEAATGTKKNLFIRKVISGTPTILLSTTTILAPGTNYRFEIDRTLDGRIFLTQGNHYFGATLADTAVTTPTSLEIAATGAGPGSAFNEFGNIYVYQYITPGKFISRTFNTTYSTPGFPVFGPFGSTFTVNTNNIETQTDFYTQTSTSPNNDLWTGLVAASDTLRILSASNQYIRYEADLLTFVSTKTPSVSAVSLEAATYGEFTTVCIQPGSNITSWGQLNCALTTTGGGALVLDSTSAVSCSQPIGNPDTWTTQTNNATLNIATNTAVWIGFRSTLVSGADMAQVDACTLNWINGASAQSTFGIYDPIHNSIYWDMAVNNSSTNNRVLKYDLNLLQFFPFDLQALALRMVNNQVYFGSSNNGAFNAYGNAIQTDNGAAINSYWTSKDFAGADPFRDTMWQRAFVVANNVGNGSLNVTLADSFGNTDAYSISLSTGVGIPYVRSGHSIRYFSSSPFMHLTLSNNAANQPWDINGIKLDFFTKDFSLQNP